MKKEIKQTITIIIISLLLCFAGKAQSYYAGILGTSKGVGLCLGVDNNNVIFETGYNVPIIKADIATLIYLTGGYKINLTCKEEDNYSFTLYIGVSYYNKKIFNEYEQIGHIKTFYPIINFELGKDIYMGRISLTASYCQEVYWGATMKVFLNR